MFDPLMNDFLKPAMLYGLWPVLLALGVLVLAACGALWRRRFFVATAFVLLVPVVAASIPVYHDTVMRVRDAAPDVVRLWGMAYPGAFALTAAGEPGLPRFVPALRARVTAWTGGPDWFSYADDCLRIVAGRQGDRRYYDLTQVALADGACRSRAAMAERYRTDMRLTLGVEYARLQSYAARVAAGDRKAQDYCPPFFSQRGAHQERVRDESTGLMRPLHDLSGHRCACVALGRHEGCRAVDERDRREGYVAAFATHDFFTPLTCDQSSICTILRQAGFDLPLAGEDINPPAALRAERIASATARCIAAGQFSPERREMLCGCSAALLLGQDPRLPRLSPAAAECLAAQGGLDEAECVIGEGDWATARQAVFMCIEAERGG